jgi:capsular polysaccharide biosynthesis protein
MTETQATPSCECDDEISLLDILVILAESWGLLVFGPLVAGLLAGGLSFLWPNTYESVAIVRLTEEEAALFHAAPVLDSLVKKFGYLELADGFHEDARNAVKANLTFAADKKTKLVTATAKGRSPEAAQALGYAAFEALFVELVPKGNEKKAIEQEIAVNTELIASGVLYADRSANKQNPANATDATNVTKAQIANLKLNNLELSLKLRAKGSEVFVQAPSLPQRKTSPKHRSVVILAALASGFALIVFVFIRNKWRTATLDPKTAGKMAHIRRALGLKVLQSA